MEEFQRMLVIDWRNFAKNMSYSIMSGSIACAYPTEPEEIAHRIMKRIFCIKQEYPDCLYVFANDIGPYWRTSFLQEWYSARGIEPGVYKGNRTKISWPFVTQPNEMENLYKLLLEHAAKSLGATIVQDKGLEADDIWGLLCKTYPGKLVGYSGDSDWRQTITDKVTVYDFTHDVLYGEPCDIRIKWIGGDAGDNVKGCSKNKKDGTPARNGWGPDGAKKLLLEPDWESKLNAEELNRNKTVTTLPCPLWDAEEAADSMSDCSIAYDQTDEFWDEYGVTEPVRKALTQKSNRDIYVSKLRLYLINKKTEDAEKEKKEEVTEESNRVIEAIIAEKVPEDSSVSEPIDNIDNIDSLLTSLGV